MQFVFIHCKVGIMLPIRKKILITQYAIELLMADLLFDNYVFFASHVKLQHFNYFGIILVSPPPTQAFIWLINLL